MKHRRRPEADLVLRVHDALLPKGIPVVPGVEVSARYLLADTHVGSDWFDVIPLDDGRLVVCVGDVVGDGVEASAAMGGLRTVFDDRVRDDGDLATALGALERRARRAPETRATTICAAVFDPATGQLLYCTAGHPPPVAVDHAGRASYLPTSGALPLGSGDGTFPTLTHHLEPGELVLLYGDGLVRRPGRTPEEGAAELLEALSGMVAGPAADRVDTADDQLADRVCQGTLELLTGVTGYDDDITVLALRRVEPIAPLRLELPAVPDAARAARAELGDWMASLHVSVLDDLAVRHAVGELVANAAEHAYERPGVRDQVRLTAVLEPNGVLAVEIDDDGRWRDRLDLPANRGRGLALVRGFMDDLTLERDERGTRATIRHLLTRPAVLLRGVPSGRLAAAAVRHFSLVVNGTRLLVAGDLDQEGADELRRALVLSSQGGTRALEVDLSEVRLLASVGVQVLLDARAEGEVRLLAPAGSPAQHVLELTRVPYDA